MVRRVVDEAHEHLHVLEGSSGISAPLAGHFARVCVVLEHDSVVRLELHLAVIVTVEGAVVRTLHGEQVPAVSNGVVLEGGCVLRSEGVKHGVCLSALVFPT